MGLGWDSGKEKVDWGFICNAMVHKRASNRRLQEVSCLGLLSCPGDPQSLYPYSTLIPKP